MTSEKHISIQDVFHSLEQRLSLNWVASLETTHRIIARQADNKRTETLAGPLNYIHPNRLQVIGQTELDYLNDMSGANRNDALEQVIRSRDGQDNPKRIVGFIGACFSNALKYNVRKEHNDGVCL